MSERPETVGEALDRQLEAWKRRTSTRLHELGNEQERLRRDHGQVARVAFERVPADILDVREDAARKRGALTFWVVVSIVLSVLALSLTCGLGVWVNALAAQEVSDAS